MKRCLLVIVFGIIAVVVFAGDMAVLENLGFSADGRYFMFGQHMLINETGQAYAEAAIVDVPKNDFVSGGYRKGGWNIPSLPNINSRGALYELRSEFREMKNRYGISHLEQGRLLYTRNNGDDTAVSGAGNESAAGLSFRDFERGRDFEVVLNQESSTDSGQVSSAFSIDLAVVDSNGAASSYSAGRPGYFRKGIASYRVVRIWSSPNGRSLIIAVAKESENLSVRYMVETLTLDN